MYESELDVAKHAAKQAATIILHYYQRDIAIKRKHDDSPVTVVDIKAETMIRQILSHAFPAYGFLGEESGGEIDHDGFTWLVDPLDGTKSFVRGYPFISTQIALLHKGKPIIGVSSAPIFGEIACAIVGQGAWLNGKRMQVSNVNQLRDATLSSGNIRSLAASSSWMRFGGLLKVCDRTRGYGDFYHYHLLASGRIDIVIESDLNILDIAALSLVVSEAGGKFTSLSGENIGLNTTNVLATNSWLHSRAQSELAWQGP